MKRILSWVIGLPVAIVAVVFAIANRRMVSVSLDPFSLDDPFLAINMPLWVLFFAGIFVGILAGGVAAWLRQGKWRQAARRSQADLENVKHENQDLRRQLSRNDLLPSA